MVDFERLERQGRVRSGGRAGRKAQRSTKNQVKVVQAGMSGGAYKTLKDTDLKKIHHAALDILATVGLAEATPEVIALATECGCVVSDVGRLCFPEALIEDVLAKAANEYVVYSRNSDHADLHVGDYRVHYATSGEAVTIFDFSSKTYRPSTLLDLYDACRLVDKLEFVHQFGQTVIPTEISDLDEHDFNVAYALVAGTEKPFEMTFNRAKNIKGAIQMFDMV